MKTIITKADLKYCYPIHQEEESFLRSIYIEGDRSWLSLPDEAEIEDATGCAYHMVESLEDLKQISTIVREGKELVYKDITQQALEFDDVRWSKSGDHLIIFSGETNSGGPVWYIPRKIVAEVPTVFQSLEATQLYWSRLT